MTDTTRTIPWDGTLDERAAQALEAPGGLVVAATKVGYILMTTDGTGLERKFDAKQRNRDKPGVVLCTSIAQLQELAVLNDEILAFYQEHWDADVLLGCILPWREDAKHLIPDEVAGQLAMDRRGTSCFVIRFGRPAEQLAERLWESRRLSFASSANPSGKGNRGRVEGIGERIEQRADVIAPPTTTSRPSSPASTRRAGTSRASWSPWSTRRARSSPSSAASARSPRTRPSSAAASRSTSSCRRSPGRSRRGTTATASTTDPAGISTHEGPRSTPPRALLRPRGVVPSLFLGRGDHGAILGDMPAVPRGHAQETPAIARPRMGRNADAARMETYREAISPRIGHEFLRGFTHGVGFPGGEQVSWLSPHHLMHHLQ